jgi:hypothetical protein
VTKLWIVGQLLPDESDNAWSFQGVFSSEAKANEACLGPEYFIGPANLDAPILDESMPWPEAYRPIGTAH